MTKAGSKNYLKLKDVSNCFTEDTLKDMLCTVYKGKSAEVSSWEFDQASAKGDNYLSDVYKIKITGTVDGQEVEKSIVVKSLPKNIGRRNTYRSTEFFRNEILFYTKVIPAFQQFLEKKGQNDILRIPRLLASVMDGENDYIAMENVLFLGYDSIHRQDCITKDQCIMILKTLAKFHAISFAYKDQKNEEFEEILDNVHETYFSKNHWNWYKRFHVISKVTFSPDKHERHKVAEILRERLMNIAKNALALEYPGSEAQKRYNSYKLDELFNKAAEFCDRKYQPTSVICHGDSWVPNYMFNEKNGSVLMVDFQLVRCTSPVLDISTCIYGCTDKSLWDEDFDNLLKSYYNELSNTIAFLGSNPDNLYSWSTFMDEIKEQFVFGAVFAMEMIPLSLLDESDAFDLNAIIKDDNAVDIDDVWTLSNIKSQSGRLRLANMFVHAVEKGFL